MATKKSTSSNNPQIELKQLRHKLAEIKLKISAQQEKNTNAHKPLKKQIAQLLTKLNQKQ